jgi:dTDP-4-amino-4,6-dideoxygalactose transaminase
MEPRYYHHLVGANFRMDALQAAILRVKAPRLAAWTDARRANADRYRQLFREAGLLDRVTLPIEAPDRRHIYNQFVIRFPEGSAVRDRVMAHLKSVSIGCEIYYPLTLPQQECFRDVPTAREAYPSSDAAAAQSLAIPIFPELTAGQIEEVVREIVQGLG